MPLKIKYIRRKRSIYWNAIVAQETMLLLFAFPIQLFPADEFMTTEFVAGCLFYSPSLIYFLDVVVS